MVLTPDADQKVAWSMAYNWAREPEQIYHDPNWQNTLFPGSTAVRPLQSIAGRSIVFHQVAGIGFEKVFDARGRLIAIRNTNPADFMAAERYLGERPMATGVYFIQSNPIEGGKAVHGQTGK
jgi:hypothetical protein